MKKKHTKKADQLAYSFYMAVFSYLSEEYKPKCAKLFADSDISPQIYDLCSQYYWGGNSVPFTAGQIADLLKSKYK